MPEVYRFPAPSASRRAGGPAGAVTGGAPVQGLPGGAAVTVPAMSDHVLPHGAWPSRVSARDLVTGVAQPTDTWAERGVVWWSQSRPVQGGRIQVVRRDPDGTLADALPGDFNARTRVHEYGG